MLIGGWSASSAVCRAVAAEIVDIEMVGTPGGARVWFSPAGVLIRPGQAVRWTNLDKGNSHTATGYHPERYGRQRRAPLNAGSWDSGFLLPGEHFMLSFNVPGVYDYYCLPHEHAGMVGRIIVATPDIPPTLSIGADGIPPPEIALKAFPSVERIRQDTRVELAPEAGEHVHHNAIAPETVK
jgi:Plastocyanin